MNYYKIYKEDGDIKKDKPSDNYYHLIKLYYTSKSMCPKCDKEVISKSKDDNIIKLFCKKCKWSATIHLAKYIDLYSRFSDLMQQKTDIIYRLLNIIKNKNYKEDVNKLKSEYEKVDQEYQNINKIFTDEKDQQTDLLDEQFNKIHQYSDLYFRRKELFNEIDEPISGTQRKALIEEYKKGVGKDHVKLVKSLGLSENTVKNWFSWMESIEDYIKLTVEVNNAIKNYRSLVEKQNELNTNFLVNSGKITESKNIKV